MSRVIGNPFPRTSTDSATERNLRELVRRRVTPESAAGRTGAILNVVPVSGVVTPNYTTTYFNRVVLSTDAIIEMPLGLDSEEDEGQTLILMIVRSGTDPIDLTWASVYHWPSGMATPLSEEDEARDILTFIFDGSAIYGVHQRDFLEAPRS
jgi:hypothetical protein